MEPKNLLVVDDEEAFCRVMAAMLPAFGYRVLTETDARRVMSILEKQPIDVVLLDLVMPHIDGLDLLVEIRDRYPDLAILVVSGYGNTETTVEAMRRGATDFVSKPVEASLLDLRIRGAFEMVKARQLANTDGLTGLYNHRHLQERLLQEIERAERYERPLSVVMADLDHFKAFNDTYGHLRGDEVLIAVAHTLRQVSRASDIVARYGGEEFLLILPEAELDDARQVAERARRQVEALSFKQGGTENVTLSLGVARHVLGGSKEALIQAADAALYVAKREGRNRVSMAEGAGEMSSVGRPEAMRASAS